MTDPRIAPVLALVDAYVDARVEQADDMNTDDLQADRDVVSTRAALETAIRELAGDGEVVAWRFAGGVWISGEPLPCDYKDADHEGWTIELAYSHPSVAVPKGLVERLKSIAGTKRAQSALDEAIAFIKQFPEA